MDETRKGFYLRVGSIPPHHRLPKRWNEIHREWTAGDVLDWMERIFPGLQDALGTGTSSKAGQLHAVAPTQRLVSDATLTGAEIFAELKKNHLIVGECHSAYCTMFPGNEIIHLATSFNIKDHSFLAKFAQSSMDQSDDSNDKASGT
jgi:hypothetical protein